LFADDPKAPFSIHKFVEHGASACGKHPGEWFGPSATAMCIQYVFDSFVVGMTLTKTEHWPVSTPSRILPFILREMDRMFSKMPYTKSQKQRLGLSDQLSY
jgi:hypothetical protein